MATVQELVTSFNEKTEQEKLDWLNNEADVHDLSRMHDDAGMAFLTNDGQITGYIVEDELAYNALMAG